MSRAKLIFHQDSRKPFPEELGVVEAVKRTRERILSANAGVEGTALFRIRSHVSARATVIPQAVDIIREGMVTAVEQASKKGHAQNVIEAHQGGQTQSSAIQTARREVSDSLRRLGIEP